MEIDLLVIIPWPSIIIQGHLQITLVRQELSPYMTFLKMTGKYNRVNKQRFSGLQVVFLFSFHFVIM